MSIALKPEKCATAHTPGPWEVSFGKVWAISPWNARVMIASASEFSPMNGINNHANARLIAAAPDMLKALKEARDILRGKGVPGWGEAKDIINAAIAKAEPCACTRPGADPLGNCAECSPAPPTEGEV